MVEDATATKYASPRPAELGASAPGGGPAAAVNSCTVDCCAPNNISAPSPVASPRPAEDESSATTATAAAAAAVAAAAPGAAADEAATAAAAAPTAAPPTVASPQQQCQALRQGIELVSKGHLKQVPCEHVTLVYQHVIQEVRDPITGLASVREVRAGALLPVAAAAAAPQAAKAAAAAAAATTTAAAATAGGGATGKCGQYTEVVIKAVTLELQPQEAEVLAAAGGLIPAQLKPAVIDALKTSLANTQRREAEQLRLIMAAAGGGRGCGGGAPATPAAAPAAAGDDLAAALSFAPLLGYDVVFVAPRVFVFVTFW